MDKIIIHVRQYRKGVEVRYVDGETGEVIYDMTMYGIETSKLSEIIGGIEKMNCDRFDGVQISWDVKYDE